jgi:hypothetical protein
MCLHFICYISNKHKCPSISDNMVAFLVNTQYVAKTSKQKLKFFM